jgi:hypothetical protein
MATFRSKEKLENARKYMSAYTQLMNTRIKDRWSSFQTKMMEMFEIQGKEIINTMKKLSEMEEKKIIVAGKIADKQLEYFKIYNSHQPKKASSSSEHSLP